MIYVLSNNRIETMKWARSQGLAMSKVRHVQNAGSLPGVLNPKTTRMVKLASYGKRYDKFAINARLKSITRRRNIVIEQWAKRDDEVGDYYQVLGEPAVVPPELSTEDLLKLAVEHNAEFDLGVELDDVDAPGVTALDVQVSLETSVVPEKFSEAKEILAKHGLQVTNRTLNAEFSGGENETTAGGAAQTFLPRDPEPVNADEPEVVEPAEKPKRVRRTNVQIAYDKALVDWESNGGSVEAVKAARKALKAGDERLESDPTEPDDLDF